MIDIDQVRAAVGAISRAGSEIDHARDMLEWPDDRATEEERRAWEHARLLLLAARTTVGHALMSVVDRVEAEGDVAVRR